MRFPSHDTLRHLLGMDTPQFREVESILRYAERGDAEADADTLRQVADGLRDQLAAEHAPAGLQAEVDGVVARYRAAHPETVRGGETMAPPAGPSGPTPD